MAPRLTIRAERDIEEILRETRKLFGPRQVLSYAALIDRSMAMADADPARASSTARPELGPDVRTLHVELASGRRGSASHLLYYMQMAEPGGASRVVVLRVLHEGMEPRRRGALPV